MAYALISEFVEKVGEAEARQLAPVAAGTTPPYEEARISAVLQDASDVLDTYLASRYTTPLAPAPAILRGYAIDLAREALDRAGRDTVKAAADRARAWAKDVAKGLATLGSAADGDDPVPPAGGGPAVAAAPSTFDGGQLDSWMPSYASGGR